MPPKPQTIHVDRVRFSAPWAAWWAMFLAVCTGVWYVRRAKSVVEQVVNQVRELRVEMKVVRLMWEVHQVGGTNRIFVQPTDVYR